MRIIAFTDDAYGLWKIATLQTTLEGRKGVKHPLILPAQASDKTHRYHKFTEIGKHLRRGHGLKVSGSRGSAQAAINRAKEHWLGPRDARMRSDLRSQKHLRAKQARERIPHSGSSRAAPLHAPGANLAVLITSDRVGIGSRRHHHSLSRSLRAAPSADTQRCSHGALAATCGAAAHLWVSEVQPTRPGRPPLTCPIELVQVHR
jgi:hypothetical protein